MNKILRYSFVALMAMIGFGNAMAEEKTVVFDFNAMDLACSHSANADQGIEASTAGDILETKSMTVDGVELIISPKDPDNKNENRFWETKNGPQLRCYSGTITLKASEKMTSIEFTSSTSKFNLTSAVGAINGKTWSGDATEVEFAVGGNTQLDKITITIGGSVNPDPQPQGPEKITVAKAQEIIAALGDGKTTDDEYIIDAYIVTDPEWKPYTDKETGEVKNYNVTFFINDTQSEEGALYVYNIWNIENTYFPTQHESVVKGAFVSVQGKLQKYVKNDVVTPELVKAHFLSYDATATSISSKTATQQNNAAVYNLAGQRVNQNYKGLVIKNGKKVVVK